MKFSLKTLIPLITIVLSVSSNSFAMIYTDHAKDRMVERGLISKDIERTLEIGTIFEENSETNIAIDQLREIAVIFNPNGKKVIITAMRQANQKWFALRDYKMELIKESTALQDEKNKNTQNVLAFGKLFKLSKNKYLAYDPSTQVAVFSNQFGVTKTTLLLNPSIKNNGKIVQLIDEDPIEEVEIEQTIPLNKLKGLSGKNALENYYN
jgi:hypothetical protein